MAAVGASVRTHPASASTPRISRPGLGVEVRTSCGPTPSRSPSLSIASASAPRSQAQTSSPQAAWNCGPLSRSGSPAENSSPTAPPGNRTRRNDGS